MENHSIVMCDLDVSAGWPQLPVIPNDHDNDDYHVNWLIRCWARIKWSSNWWF